MCNINRYVFRCTLFDPVVTDSGICHSFNAVPSLDLLVPSYFTKSFESAFGPDMSEKNFIVHGDGSGEQNAFEFSIFDKSGLFDRKSKQDKRFSYYVSLSSKDNYFDANSNGQEIVPGFLLKWRVNAMEIKSGEGIQDKPIEKRKCRFAEEAENLRLFRSYSQTACTFECRVRNAFEYCQCYPWNMPAEPNNTRHVLCDVFGNYCFKHIMNKKDTWHACEDCLPTCDQIEFSIAKEAFIRDDDEICQDHKAIEYILASNIVSKEYNSLLYKYLSIKDWIDLGANSSLAIWDQDRVTYDLCKSIVMNHLTKVSIMFDKTKYVRTERNLRVTFNDKLADLGKFLYNLLLYSFYMYIHRYIHVCVSIFTNSFLFTGGTLGLFTGMSILSLFEVVFWFIKSLPTVLKVPARSKNRRNQYLDECC